MTLTARNKMPKTDKRAAKLAASIDAAVTAPESPMDRQIAIANGEVTPETALPNVETNVPNPAILSAMTPEIIAAFQAAKLAYATARTLDAKNGFVKPAVDRSEAAKRAWVTMRANLAADPNYVPKSRKANAEPVDRKAAAQRAWVTMRANKAKQAQELADLKAELAALKSA